MSSTIDTSTNALAPAPKVDPSPGVDSTEQVPGPEPLFPADLIEECFQEYLRDQTAFEPDSTPRKRWSRHRVRLGSSTIEPVTKGDISGRWSAATTDTEYFSESALYTDGGLPNRGKTFTVRVYEGETSSSDHVGGSVSGGHTSKGEYGDSSSGDVWSDDDQSDKEPMERGCGDNGDICDTPRILRIAASDDGQSISDDGYRVDYDDDDSEDLANAANVFSDVEQDLRLRRYPTNAVFYSMEQSTDGYDTDYDDEYNLRVPRQDSPNIDEVNQRINEYLWSTM